MAGGALSLTHGRWLVWPWEGGGEGGRRKRGVGCCSPRPPRPIDGVGVAGGGGSGVRG